MTETIVNISQALKFYSLDSDLKIVRKHVSFRAAARFVKRQLDKNEDKSKVMYVYEEDTKQTTFYSIQTSRAERGKSIKTYTPED
jgi:hypothetical protein